MFTKCIVIPRNRLIFHAVRSGNSRHCNVTETLFICRRGIRTLMIIMLHFCYGIIILMVMEECSTLPKGMTTKHGIANAMQRCNLKSGIMRIYVPGCLQQTVKSVGCKGYCLSSTKPELADQAEHSDKYSQRCSCCKPKSSVIRNIMLRCPTMKIKVLRVRVYVATQCACYPCSGKQGVSLQ